MDTNSTARPVVIMATIIAVLQALLGAAAFTDLVSHQVFGWLQVALIVITAVYGSVVHGQVTPWSDVAAKRNRNGAIVAGPAASQTNGSKVHVESGFVDVLTALSIALLGAAVMVLVMAPALSGLVGLVLAVGMIAVGLLMLRYEDTLRRVLGRRLVE